MGENRARRTPQRCQPARARPPLALAALPGDRHVGGGDGGKPSQLRPVAKCTSHFGHALPHFDISRKKAPKTHGGELGACHWPYFPISAAKTPTTYHLFCAIPNLVACYTLAVCP